MVVADANLQRANWLQQTLLAGGYDVRLTLTAQEAKSYVSRNEPDLIMLCADTSADAAVTFCREIRNATLAFIFLYSPDSDKRGKIRHTA